MAPPGQKKTLVFNLALLLAATLVGLVLLELAVRFWPSEHHYGDLEAFFGEDWPVSGRYYRDYVYNEKKKPGVFRIIAVGDSFTRGSAVNFDDSYPKRLERYLNYFGNDQGTRYQVMNLGLAQKSTADELRLIHREAERLDPDLIILGYCLNDAEDWQKPKEIETLRTTYKVHHFRESDGASGFLYDRSALFRLVSRRLFNRQTHRGHIDYYHHLYREDYSGWQKTRASLEGLAGFSRKTGIPVLVVIFPLLSFELDDQYPFHEIHKLLHRTMRKAALPYLDLTRMYRKVDHLRLEAVPYRNPHPSELAHRIAAEGLWRQLIERKLVPTTMIPGRMDDAPSIPSPF
jgi:hypothetical protein